MTMPLKQQRPLRVLLTNDDGPPSASESPMIGSFARALKEFNGWDVRVVVPSSQKSWIGGAYQIADTITGSYYYPKGPADEGETTAVSRPLKEGEHAEWILLDGTPATCSNIGLHNLYPGEIDLVLSGPNNGRNTSAAFSLASGTIGATLGSTLAGVRSIALSYALFDRKFTPRSLELANVVACRVVKALWEDWGKDAGLAGGNVGLYTVNVPLQEEALEHPKFLFTRVFNNSYKSLFKPLSVLPPVSKTALPDAARPAAEEAHATEKKSAEEEQASRPLAFRFAPVMDGLVNPDPKTLPEGTDTWAIHNGYVTISPLRPCFDQAGSEGLALGSGAGAGKAVGVGREWLLEVPAPSRSGL